MFCGAFLEGLLWKIDSEDALAAQIPSDLSQPWGDKICAYGRGRENAACGKTPNADKTLPVTYPTGSAMPSKYLVDSVDCKTFSPLPGIRLSTTWCEQMLMSLVEMEPGAVIPLHSHPHEQVGRLLEGEIELVVGDETHIVLPGQMWRIPGGVSHKVTAGIAGAKAWDVFYPIREDYQ